MKKKFGLHPSKLLEEERGQSPPKIEAISFRDNHNAFNYHKANKIIAEAENNAYREKNAIFEQLGVMQPIPQREKKKKVRTSSEKKRFRRKRPSFQTQKYYLKPEMDSHVSIMGRWMKNQNEELVDASPPKFQNYFGFLGKHQISSSEKKNRILQMQQNHDLQYNEFESSFKKNLAEQFSDEDQGSEEGQEFRKKIITKVDNDDKNSEISVMNEPFYKQKQLDHDEVSQKIHLSKNQKRKMKKRQHQGDDKDSQLSTNQNLEEGECKTGFVYKRINKNKGLIKNFKQKDPYSYLNNKENISNNIPQSVLDQSLEEGEEKDNAFYDQILRKPLITNPKRIEKTHKYRLLQEKKRKQDQLLEEAKRLNNSFIDKQRQEQDKILEQLKKKSEMEAQSKREKFWKKQNEMDSNRRCALDILYQMQFDAKKHLNNIPFQFEQNLKPQISNTLIHLNQKQSNFEDDRMFTEQILEAKKECHQNILDGMGDIRKQFNIQPPELNQDIKKVNKDSNRNRKFQRKEKQEKKNDQNQENVSQHSSSSQEFQDTQNEQNQNEKNQQNSDEKLMKQTDELLARSYKLSNIDLKSPFQKMPNPQIGGRYRNNFNKNLRDKQNFHQQRGLNFNNNKSMNSRSTSRSSDSSNSEEFNQRQQQIKQARNQSLQQQKLLQLERMEQSQGFDVLKKLGELNKEIKQKKQLITQKPGQIQQLTPQSPRENNSSDIESSQSENLQEDMENPQQNNQVQIEKNLLNDFSQNNQSQQEFDSIDEACNFQPNFKNHNIIFEQKQLEEDLMINQNENVDPLSKLNLQKTNVQNQFQENSQQNQISATSSPKSLEYEKQDDILIKAKLQSQQILQSSNPLSLLDPKGFLMPKNQENLYPNNNNSHNNNNQLMNLNSQIIYNNANQQDIQQGKKSSTKTPQRYRQQVKLQQQQLGNSQSLNIFQQLKINNMKINDNQQEKQNEQQLGSSAKKSEISDGDLVQFLSKNRDELKKLNPGFLKTLKQDYEKKKTVMKSMAKDEYTQQMDPRMRILANKKQKTKQDKEQTQNENKVSQQTQQQPQVQEYNKKNESFISQQSQNQQQYQQNNLPQIETEKLESEEKSILKLNSSIQSIQDKTLEQSQQDIKIEKKSECNNNFQNQKIEQEDEEEDLLDEPLDFTMDINPMGQQSINIQDSQNQEQQQYIQNFDEQINIKQNQTVIYERITEGKQLINRDEHMAKNKLNFTTEQKLQDENQMEIELENHPKQTAEKIEEKQTQMRYFMQEQKIDLDNEEELQNIRNNRCNRCNQQGHIERFCTQADQQRACVHCLKIHQQNQVCTSILCFQCYQTGHMIKDCPLRDPKQSHMFSEQQNLRCRFCSKKGHDCQNCQVLVFRNRNYTISNDKRKMKEAICLYCEKLGHFNCNREIQGIDHIYKF